MKQKLNWEYHQRDLNQENLKIAKRVVISMTVLVLLLGLAVLWLILTLSTTSSIELGHLSVPEGNPDIFCGLSTITCDESPISVLK